MRNRFSNFIWGIFLLLAAVFLVVNQFSGFMEFGVGRIIAIIISVLFIAHIIADLNFSLLPIPVAILYFVFRASLGLPYIRAWTLIASTALAVIGLSILMPKRFSWGGKKHRQQKINTENFGNDNNPVINVKFGAISRRLQAESLETVNLSCSFGAIELFLNQAKLSPNGAEIFINCNFGGIELNIPKDWQVVDNIKCSLGGIEVDRRNSSASEDSPKLTLNGSVSLGGIEVRYV